MHYKRWVKWYLVTVLAVIGLFALFNYTIDPLWTFCHSNRYNNAQPGFDERQLKTNRAYFCGLEQYDTLLLGSSRTTYINQHDFKGMKVFNYAAVSTYPSEYKGWIDVAKKIKWAPFKTIIIGMDFFGSNDGPFGKQQMAETPPASHYFDVTTSFFYRYKMLFSMDTLHKSLDAIAHSKTPGTVDYDRYNVKHTIHISAARKQQVVAQQQGLYGHFVYGAGYHYNTKVRASLEALKKENPHTRFVIFTTPISSDLFKLLVKQGRLKDYERWLRMLVDVFGEVYDFMGVNTITKNPKNYADLHHFYPEYGRLIAERVAGVDDPAIPKDFGIRVNRTNIDAHLRAVREEAEKIRSRK